jgi:hypothetical protein
MVVNHPKPSAKNETGDFAKFTAFMKRLVAVPHSEIKAALDREKREKQQRKRPSGHASGGKD